MRKNRTVIFLLLMMFITACTADRQQDDKSEILINSGNEVSANQMDASSVIQTNEKNIVCENPYFFPQNTSFITADITYFNFVMAGTIVELELEWLKQYDRGCLTKLSVVSFDDMPDYMDETRLNTYFYVTDVEIYQISPFIVKDNELFTFYNDDILLMSILDTDEKLIENGELVCCLRDVESHLAEGEVGAHITIEQQEKQILCNRVDVRQNEDLDYYENFIWEEGVGLVGYISGYGTEVEEKKEIIDLRNIIYGVLDQTEDRDILCENPYFFKQNISELTADLTYDDFSGGITTINNDLELHWLKQYDNGCLVRLSVVLFDEIPNYMDMKYLNFYFYVTPNNIYRIHFYVASKYFNSYYEGLRQLQDKNYFYNTSYDSAGRSFENMDVYIDHNDDLIMSVLSSDERLLEYGELIFCQETMQNNVEDGEEGVCLSMRQESGQVIYSRSNVTPYNLNDWENYCWENGFGLVEYRKGFRAERDPFYIENIIVK